LNNITFLASGNETRQAYLGCAEIPPGQQSVTIGLSKDRFPDGVEAVSMSSRGKTALAYSYVASKTEVVFYTSAFVIDMNGEVVPRDFPVQFDFVIFSKV